MDLKKIEIRCAATGYFTDVYLRIENEKIDFLGCSAYPAGNDDCIRCSNNAVIAYINPKAAKRNGIIR